MPSFCEWKKDSILDRFSLQSLTSTQEIVLKTIVQERRDVFLVARTGSGKSMCYQGIPDACDDFKNCVLIFSPLKSISTEQVTYLREKKLTAVRLTDDSSVDKQIMDGEMIPNFIFSDPETILNSKSWRDSILTKKMSVDFIVVDEAHTVEKWGVGYCKTAAFREAFSRIGELRSICSAPILAMTATAAPSTRKMIKRSLILKSPLEVVESPDRSNIQLNVQKLMPSAPCKDSLEWIIRELEQYRQNCERFLIFCVSKQKAGEVYTTFEMAFLDKPRLMKHVDMYHAMTNANVQCPIRNDMSDPDGQIRVLVCTEAAGMGVNFANCTQIVHYHSPRSMDTFVQQLGRAGRSGEHCQHLLLYSGTDIPHLSQEMRDFVKDTKTCRRTVITNFYGVTAQSSTEIMKHDCCDSCKQQCQCSTPEKCTLGFHAGVQVVSNSEACADHKLYDSLSEILEEDKDSVCQIINNLSRIHIVEDIYEFASVFDEQLAEDIFTVLEPVLEEGEHNVENSWSDECADEI